MVKLRLFAVAVAGALFVIAAPSASADSTPSVPGLSGGSQPVSAAGNAGGQPASVAAGRSGAQAQGQSANGSTCGAQAGAGTQGFGAQPAQAGSSGTSTPTGCAATASKGSAITGQGRTAAVLNSATGGSAAQPAKAFDRKTASSRKSATGAWLDLLPWLFLGLLAALLFVLLGVVAARRRKPATAKS
jgi:hypothetical protein